MNDFLAGAIVMGWGIVSLFFLRFWRNSGDRFFLYFAAAFFLEGLTRLLTSQLVTHSEASPAFYLIRLLAYGLILWAIIEKNLPPRRHDK